MPNSMIAYYLHGQKDLRAENKPKPGIQAGHVLIHPCRMGICGSDMHYYLHGYCGAFVPKRPFILGHEFAGEIVEVGEGVKSLKVKDRVAVDPSHPCHACDFCLSGRYNLCENMRFLGSASVDPHVDGGFCEYISMPAQNCYLLPDGLDYGKAALLEPLSVCIHAAKRPGSVFGKNVLITGGGTIGQLLLQVLKIMGAAKVTLSDVKKFARDFSLEQGADAVLDPSSSRNSNDIQKIAPKGFDLIFEASGAPPALQEAIKMVKKGGTLVQVGTFGEDIPLPANLLMSRELTVLGSFRFTNVFPEAISLVNSGKGFFDNIITHTFPFGNLVEGIEQACSGEGVLKVQVGSA